MSRPADIPLLSPELQARIQRRLQRRPLCCRLPGATAGAYRTRAQAAFAQRLRRGWPWLATAVAAVAGTQHLLLAERLSGPDGLVWQAMTALGALLALLVTALGWWPGALRGRLPLATAGFTLMLAALLSGTLLARDPVLAQHISYLLLLTGAVVLLGTGLPLREGLVCVVGAPLLAVPLALGLGARPDWEMLGLFQLVLGAALLLQAALAERLRRFGFLQTLLLEAQAGELARQQLQLERRTQTDALTGLANRRHFDAVIGREWERLLREQQPLAVLLLDVDHFGPYNARYGAGAGDTCLGLVGMVLQAAILRPADFAARFGGDEFAVLLPNTDSAGARKVAERILTGIGQARLPHAAAPAGDHVTVSIGYAATIPARGGSASALLRAAEEALQHSKHMGRHCATAATSLDLALV